MCYIKVLGLETENDFGAYEHYILAKSTMSTHAKFIMLKGVSSDDMYISNIICITIYGIISLNDYNYTS